MTPRSKVCCVETEKIVARHVGGFHSGSYMSNDSTIRRRSANHIGHFMIIEQRQLIQHNSIQLAWFEKRCTYR